MTSEYHYIIISIIEEKQKWQEFRAKAVEAWRNRNRFNVSSLNKLIEQRPQFNCALRWDTATPPLDTQHWFILTT